MRREIIAFLKEKIDPDFIIVRFVCKRYARPDSDVDIAFYKEGGILAPYECFLFAQELADRLNKDVDLIDLNQAPTVFQAQIFATGIVMDMKNENALNVKRMLAYRLYAKLNEERA
ncbi:nucleotidyltransferase domain-containing protein [Heyndrickxia coagulans]|uniref:Polymerase beta nucleotidyltransferase domain-containing protein n=1 Tax=Heyndrickxia coagulans TaxID=1398 RepID=A0A150K6F9_HEYCO|nr:nucleotidyltransferase domain-containing protein [Heyndrickxia coagulans]KYC65142.1 hypothetical protein B4099_1831 [Heyndrickxia coagulans]UJZ87163.1 nucleotidyltransferase domain-containing protein [Heyndrickxia coagulans]